jgi:TRAP transporter 4TM/12TM fusion protein
VHASQFGAGAGRRGQGEGEVTMADEGKVASDRAPEVDVAAMVADSDFGGRADEGFIGKLVAGLALVWSLFQLYYASNIPFTLTDLTGVNLTINADTARSWHLAFALVLAALAYPLFARDRHRLPWYDIVLAVAGALASLYLVFYKTEIAVRAGLPTTLDLIAASVGMTVLLVATYRTLGTAMVVIAAVFVAYVFFGNATWLPEVVRWKGASFGKSMWHYWMQTEGVFGIALGVSASMVFLFVLFGSLLDRAGAGNYFIKLAFALLGHLKGGPAKAAVVSSAMTGVISGSSIANVVTTGTFTIPLMKRVGFPAEKAGAVEVASSVNGQIMPPVMGAAAFLMVEYVGVSYLDVVRHAILPATISYLALVYIVHLEAVKAGMQGLPKPGGPRTLLRSLTGVLGGFAGTGLVMGGIYAAVEIVKALFGEATFLGVTLLVLAAYLALLAVAARRPDLQRDDPAAPATELPETIPTLLTGLYYLLPLVVLIWCLMMERLSPGLSAYWATIVMLLILLTQKPLKALLRGEGEIAARTREGFDDAVAGLIAGARNMVGIAVATGTAGVVVGTISLTGAHQIMGEFVEFLSMGNLLLMLILVAIFSLILGMGLPTTANYIVVSSLMATVVVDIGAQSGLVVPLIAVHLFVFYFGIMADVTPPVGVASFAAAAVARADPIRTGIVAFAYSIRTALLPFLFIFNTDLLLIDVSFARGLFVFVMATIAMLLFVAATQNWFLTRSRLWESAALLLVAFTLFRPGFWLDSVAAPYVPTAPAGIVALAGQKPVDASLRLLVQGPDFDKPDRTLTRTIEIDLGAAGDGRQRLARVGLRTRQDGGRTVLEEPRPGTPVHRALRGMDFLGGDPVVIQRIEEPAPRPPKEVFYLPALLLLGLVAFAQWSRRRRQALPA